MNNSFTHSDNILLIWELLTEQTILQNQPNNVKENISHYVVNEVHKFYDIITKKYPNISLIELNKEYIKFILFYVKKTFPDNIKKIKIHDDDSSPITYKEIQEQRELELNTKFNEMQNNFDNMISIKKPNTPIFEDTVKDEPISINLLEKQIKEMTLKRNYDNLQILNNINHSNNINNSNKINKISNNTLDNSLDNSLSSSNNINNNNNYNNNPYNNFEKTVTFSDDVFSKNEPNIEVNITEQELIKTSEKETYDSNSSNNFFDKISNKSENREINFNTIMSNLNNINKKIDSLENTLNLFLNKII